MKRFEVGEKVMLINPEIYSFLDPELVGPFIDKELTVTFVYDAGDHCMVSVKNEDWKEWSFHSDDLVSWV